MNSDNLLLAEGLVSKSYIQQGGQAIVRRQKLVKTLLSQRKLPVKVKIFDCKACGVFHVG
uniref:Uncharacterized protein n=1 Tax=Tetraselmis sp. GSL018 TaxID=582737 RepID=A0A061RFU1_9CHLO